MSVKKKVIIGVSAAVGVLAAVYIGVAIYFMYHFFYGTQINGSDFSLKTASDLDLYLEQDVKKYILTIVTKDEEKEKIDGKAIDLTYEKGKTAKNLLEKQNAFLWPGMFFKTGKSEAEPEVKFDEKKLEKAVAALKCVTQEQTDPTDAVPVFDGEKFIPGGEVLGTKLDMEVFSEKINEAVSGFHGELDLKEEGCYQLPKFTIESPEVQKACDAMNQYLKASITYDMAPNKEVVDKELISTWLECDADMNVTFLEDKVREYMTQFAARYETLGATRPLTTPWGKQTEVYGGTYGWAFDEAAEADMLIASIKAGEVLTKEPAYEQQAASHEEQDWGTTFIEVDLSEQYMWYISDGNVVFETAVVTGKPYEHSTPCGVYDILLMQLNATLVGNIVPETGEPEYRTPVDYWMQVTWGGVGFHDADWQPAFGGDLYWSIGSHGCINMPVAAAGQLYGLISRGTPVVMHY